MFFPPGGGAHQRRVSPGRAVVHVVEVVVADGQTEGDPCGIQNVNRLGGIDPFDVLGRAVFGRVIDRASIAVLDRVANMRNEP